MNKFKHIVRIILFVSVIIIGIVTLLIIAPDLRNILFSRGSLGSTMEIFGPSFWIEFILYLFMLFATILFRKRVVISLISFVFILSIWLLCGRTVGIQWTGEVTTGWLYFRTNQVSLNDGFENYDEDPITNTRVTKSGQFSLRFTHKNKDKIIFVGPIIRRDLIEYFDK